MLWMFVCLILEWTTTFPRVSETPTTRQIRQFHRNVTTERSEVDSWRYIESCVKNVIHNIILSVTAAASDEEAVGSAFVRLNLGKSHTRVK